MVKADSDNYKNMLREVIQLCKKLQFINETDMIIQIMSKCQETVMAVGQSLEDTVNQKDRKVIAELNIIQLLEEFCELAYQYTQNSEQVVIQKMVQIVEKVIRNIEDIPRTYRIAFLPYKAAMWDSLESIWKEFVQDENCETSVIPIPYFEANRKINQWDTCYDGDKYPSYVPVVYFQDYLLGQKKPDMIFVHNPFDQFNNVTTVHPAYYSAELKKHCGKIVYVPYYVNPGFISDDYNELPLLYRADYIVVQSEQAKETCKSFPYYNRVLALGSPKFDKVINMYNQKISPPEEWNVNLNWKKCILLNTTLTDFLESGELLMNKLHRVFEIALTRNDIVIVWRPHPLLEGTIKAMRPQYIEKFQELIRYYVDNKVGVYDETVDVSRAVAVSDAYVGSHYSSIIALFEVLNKPVFRIDSRIIYDRDSAADRKRLKPEEVFEKSGDRDFFGCYESIGYTVEDFIDDLLSDDLETIKEKQAWEEEGLASNMDGTSGRKIYEYMIAALKNDK